MKKFAVGSEYSARSICDSDCIFTIKVLKRTASFITFSDHGETRRAKIQTRDGVEGVYPFGRYSMAAYIEAK